MDTYKPLPMDIIQRPSTQYPEPGDSFIANFLSENVDVRRKANDYTRRCTVLLDRVRRRALGHGKFKKKRRKTLSSIDRKKVGLFDCLTQGLEYEAFVPLHKMWREYIEQLIPVEKLNATNAAPLSECLLKADYHGCLVAVRRSRCPSYVGVSGIVVQETQNMFKIINEANAVKIIPKYGSVFTFRVGQHCFNIHGNQFRTRVAERARKKYKFKPTLGL